MTLTPSVVDKYSKEYEEGFYLESQNTITLGSGSFVASSNTYTLTVNQTGSNTGSATFEYNYDGNPGVPVVSAITFNLNGNSYSPITGVNVIHGTQTFSVTTTASNLGTYFYKSPILDYTNSISGSWSPSSETNLANITSGKSGSAFTNPIIFSNILSASVQNTYSTSFTLSVNANNVSESSSSLNATPIDAIVDGLSYTLVYSTLPQILLAIANDGIEVKGQRVKSGTAGAANVPPFNSSGTLYATLPYDNTLDITSLEELQVSNGTFTTPSGQSFAYIDYNLYYYNATLKNTVDYSVIPSTGYRYATFAWRISVGIYNSLIFTLNTQSTITITGNLAYAGANPIQLYYRFENASSATPTGLSNPLTSAWINGNSQDGIRTTAGNYFTPSNYTQEPTSGLVDPVNTSGRFKVFVPQLIVSSGFVYLYCRIGLPMNSAFSFSYVTAKMSETA
jgi:hypothetical protein